MKLKCQLQECAQAFFKSDGKEGFRESSINSREYRVRKLVVGEDSVNPLMEFSGSPPSTHRTKNGTLRTSFRGGKDRFESKSPPLCFVCAKSNSKHFLGECEKFMALSLTARRQTVIEAKRCLNCLSVYHFVRDCSRPSKCRKCGPNNYESKHATALHDFYTTGNL